MTERDHAQAENDEANAAASHALNRRHIVVREGGEDVTEAVVSVLETLSWLLNAGSSWLDDDEKQSVDKLRRILLFRCDAPIVLPEGKRWWQTASTYLGECKLLPGHEGPHELSRTKDEYRS